MSGVEIAVAAAAAVSLISSGVSGYSQIVTANKAAALQAKQIREQQVQLRLQENQASIERMKKLEAILATEEVTFGQRNISLGSGTANAFTLNNIHSFYEDENADKLNYGAKQLALSRQGELTKIQHKSQVFNAITGFVKEGAGTVMAAYGVPSKSLLDKAAGSSTEATANVGQSYGAQSFADNQRKQFNLNA